MKKIIKEYLTFSNREKRGVMGLLILLAAFTFAPYIVTYFQKEEAVDFSAFEKEIKEITVDADTHSEITYPSKKSVPIPPKITLFKFDPNNLPPSDWAKLGCSQRQITTILKYQEKGGFFKNRADLKKIYGLSALDYTRLEPFIEIKARASQNSNVRALPKKIWEAPKQLLLNLNSSDSASLTLLKGIGPAYAARIVKYRNRLGGFINTSQLWEIYGMDSTLYHLVAPCVYVNDSMVKKININTAGLDEMRKHPYFGYKIAGLIVNYRKFHGSYKNIEGIKAIVLVHGDIYSKLVPYITTEE